LIGVGLVIIILLVNIAGVKWVVRVQFIILIVLVSTILNFAVGLFVKKDAGLFLL
jgi:PREDICTED: similar to SLC12A8 cation-chloride cotransporter